ncbi:MAG: aspartate kinase [Armatimonadota bacterium]|nr:aspartate kinase [Armatimonadota bacterium]MDR5676011.1 aspartate kinase [Armatimonadota bacterium]MDR5688875.1 aspartate kinase [Armatimonadota bacterium]MDR7390391.1 aspartate kinase [Armatimonadota bacterium]MDR7391967.1 aspartate kinase [Armatimonadota bacterium]
MSLIVQKFGGSSVATPERVFHVARRVARTRRAGHQVVVVVSAPGDTTDELIQRAHRITERPSPRELDMLLAVGEQISIALLAMALQEEGERATSLTGWQVRILTEPVHTKARILDVERGRLLDELSRGRIPVVAGFQGVTASGELTTLGRGGSDTTAVAVAAALGADVCEIYTDVPGVFTADPRLVPTARKLAYLTYDEMLEMASSGAVVVQTRAAEYAKLHRVRLHVRSTFEDSEGTIIGEEPMEPVRSVNAVTHDLDVCKITVQDLPDVPGVAHRLFGVLAEAHVNVDMIVQTASRGGRADISFTVSRGDARAAVEGAERVARELGASKVESEEGVAKVSVVGAGMVSNPGVAATMFGALAAEQINIQMISTSEIKISCVIDAASVPRAVRALHRAFNLEEE